jgi:hypothetical protein
MTDQPSTQEPEPTPAATAAWVYRELVQEPSTQERCPDCGRPWREHEVLAGGTPKCPTTQERCPTCGSRGRGQLYTDPKRHCSDTWHDCTCGFGGQHDDRNPNCALWHGSQDVEGAEGPFASAIRRPGESWEQYEARLKSWHGSQDVEGPPRARDG